MGNRRRAREFTLQILFQLDLNNNEENLEERLRAFWRDYAPDTEEEIKKFATRLVKETRKNLKNIDELIKRYVENWTMERIAKVDRNILRFALCEMLYLPDIPVKVAINEAVELSKKYSTAESYQFVNGILDRVKDEVKQELVNSRKI